MPLTSTFGAASIRGFKSLGRASLIIDRTLGTNIGDMTGFGGLAAVFDGNTSQIATSGAIKSGSGTGYVGKTLSSPKYIEKAIAYGSNNVGFITNVNVSCTLSLYAKQGSSPANATDGTLLATTTFTDTSNESAGRTLTSSDQDTLYDHVWLVVSSGGSDLSCTELVLYELG